jgi:hypothetical protein
LYVTEQRPVARLDASIPAGLRLIGRDIEKLKQPLRRFIHIWEYPGR